MLETKNAAALQHKNEKKEATCCYLPVPPPGRWYIILLFGNTRALFACTYFRMLAVEITGSDVFVTRLRAAWTLTIISAVVSSESKCRATAFI